MNDHSLCGEPMPIAGAYRRMLPVLALLIPGACSNPDGPLAGSRTYVRITSDAGDPIGDGKSYELTQANAIIKVRGFPDAFDMSIAGDDGWQIYVEPSRQA